MKDFTVLSNKKLLELRGTRPRTNKGYSVSTPSKIAWCVQCAIIFSNKWLYQNISRTLQIHDQGASHNLLSVGWSFKMANTWSLINATRGNAQHLLFLVLTIDENGWFYFNRQEWLILIFVSTRLVDSIQTENQHSGRCMLFWNNKFPFWWWETTKWVTESTKCEPISTKWGTETWN